MKLSIELKGVALALISSFAALSLAFGVSEMFHAPPAPSAATPLVIQSTDALAKQGHTLFMMNCAHCHGTDARGDEGPDLHGVAKSDMRITAIIKNGIKGEMPKFSAKLNDSDVHAIIAFVRTLKK